MKTLRRVVMSRESFDYNLQEFQIDTNYFVGYSCCVFNNDEYLFTCYTII